MAVEERTTTEAAIVSAVLDYFEGWFDGDAARMERALHPDLAKRSLETDGRTLDEIDRRVDDRGHGTRSRPRARPRATARIEVEVEDVYGTIANATVRSAVYREYVQLVRTPEGWKIVNALWELT